MNQPRDPVVFNQTVITCIAPPQDPNVIREIKQKNLELHIFAYRPSDNRLSRNSFKFEYMDHVPANITTLSRFNNFHGSAPVCGFCHMEQYNNMTVELSLAKPGVQRRKADDANNEVPEHLKEELQSKSPPREDKSNNATSTTSTTILQTRSPERDLNYRKSSSPEVMIKTEPLEPILITPMQPNAAGNQPIYQIIMHPQPLGLVPAENARPTMVQRGPRGLPALQRRPDDPRSRIPLNSPPPLIINPVAVAVNRSPPTPTCSPMVVTRSPPTPTNTPMVVNRSPPILVKRRQSDTSTCDDDVVILDDLVKRQKFMHS